MQYIVLDIEWNQAWPGSYSAQRMPSLHGEIIQIGAVMLTESLRPGVEYQQLVYPKFFRKLSKRVSTLTGIKDSDLQERGLPFPTVMENFRKWCGNDPVFLTWGYDDIPMLRENLEAHGLDTGWIDNWYNLQLIFNAQTDGSSGQKALKTAMEYYGINACRPAHDALGDAYHTAVITTRLDLKKGIREYKKSKKKEEESSADIPGCISRKIHRGYESKEQALAAMADKENFCPICRKRMTANRWLSQTGHRYMAMMHCERDGDFFVRVRLAQSQEEHGLRVIRLVYEPTSEAAESYLARVEKQVPQKPGSERPAKHRFRFPYFYRSKLSTPKEDA